LTFRAGFITFNPVYNCHIPDCRKINNPKHTPGHGRTQHFWWYQIHSWISMLDICRSFTVFYHNFYPASRLQHRWWFTAGV